MILAAVFAASTLTARAASATSVLDNVVKTINGAPSLTLNVSMQVDGDTYSAVLTMARDKFSYITGGMTVLYDGKTQWTIDTAEGEVSVTTPTAAELAETNPLAFVRAYKTNYTVTLVSQSQNSYVVKMEARSKSAYVRSALITVDGSTWLPTSVSATLSTGQTMQLGVSSATKGKTLPDATFRYDTKKYPGLEVIDLR